MILNRLKSEIANDLKMRRNAAALTILWAAMQKENVSSQQKITKGQTQNHQIYPTSL